MEFNVFNIFLKFSSWCKLWLSQYIFLKYITDITSKSYFCSSFTIIFLSKRKMGIFY